MTPENATLLAALAAAAASIVAALQASRAASAVDVRKHQRGERGPAYKAFLDAVRDSPQHLAFEMGWHGDHSVSDVQDGNEGTIRLQTGTKQAIDELESTALDVATFGSKVARSQAMRALAVVYQVEALGPRANSRLSYLIDELRSIEDAFGEILRRDLDLR
jgi:hypothetical protein